MRISKALRRPSGIAVLLVVAVGAGLVGWASTGRAATGFSFDDFTSLIGSDPNVIPQVTNGAAIAYHVKIRNSGDSNATQVFIRARNTNGATFLDASNPNCGSNPSDAQQMICSVPGDTMRPGDTFETNFRFTAPSTGTTVTMNVDVVIKAQSVGGKQNG